MVKVKSKSFKVVFCVVVFSCGMAQAAIDINIPGCVIEFDFNGDLVVDTNSGSDLTAAIISDPNWAGYEPVLAPGVKGFCIDNTALPQTASTSIELRVGIEGVSNSPMQQELNKLGDYVTITCWINLDEDFLDWTHIFTWENVAGINNNLTLAWVNVSSANRTFLRKDGTNSSPPGSHPPIVDHPLTLDPPTPPVNEMNEWIFLAVTYDGSTGAGNNVGWYKGWVDANSLNRSNEQLYEWDVQDSNDKVVFLNHTNIGAFERACSIKFDEFRIFDRILTPEEIEAIRLYDLEPGVASVCGDAMHPSPSAMDFDDNCIVDFVDFATFVADWLKETPVP